MSASPHGASPEQQRSYGYSRLQRSLEIAGIAAFMLLAAWTSYRIYANASVHHPAQWGWLLGGGILAALLAADMFSGLVHWAADNWGDPSWPILGPGFIQPFRNHHVDPKDITRHDFVELNGNNCIVSIPVFFAAGYASDIMGPEIGLFTSVFALGVALWVFGTNQFHAWAHADTPPRLVRLLQRTGLLLSPKHHDVHHVAPHARHYCITNGWMDRPMQWLRLFPMIEWTVSRLSGVRPQHEHIEAALAREAAKTV
ncbi:MAG TPA: fatty acid desaturase CarF family protein [Myxococcota bacterium]|nr:fatty acid desaturase CarF family protein [Myxococcota bacterium]